MDVASARNSRSVARAMVNILLVDEYVIFREGLRKLLEAEPDFTVVGDAADPEEAVRVSRETQPDVLISGLSGRPLIRMMRTLQQQSAGADPHAVRTIVLTTTIEKTQMVQALQLGVSGILLKETSSQLLFESVRSVAAGECWVGRERLTDLVESLRQATTRGGRPIRPARFGLTPRELEVVDAVRRGETNKAIARRFAITEDTVKHHLTRIFDKVGVFSRLELALFAINHGLRQDIPAAS
jgi:two-component system, NarL family, nitrate/nitrite response regulator NarL